MRRRPLGRSDHDDGNQHGSAGPENWHRRYSGDSYDGIGKPDDEDTNQEGDE